MGLRHLTVTLHLHSGYFLTKGFQLSFNLQGRNINAIPLSSLNAASLTANYQSLNGTGLDEACLFVRICNASTADITLSFDGIEDHEFLAGTAATIPRESIVYYPGQSNVGQIPLLLHKGQIIYAKGSAGVGAIYLSGYFQSSYR